MLYNWCNVLISETLVVMFFQFGVFEKVNNQVLIDACNTPILSLLLEESSSHGMEYRIFKL